MGDSSSFLTIGSSAVNGFLLICTLSSVSLADSLSLLTGSCSGDDTCCAEPALSLVPRSFEGEEKGPGDKAKLALGTLCTV